MSNDWQAGNSAIEPALSWTQGSAVDSDTTDLTNPGRALFIETAGAVKFRTMAGEDVTVTFPVGEFHTGIRRLYTTGTADASKVWILR